MSLAAQKTQLDPQELDGIVDRACSRIAPTWPLDRFIAVNPLWGFVDEALPRVSARLASLSGSRFVMPRSWYREQWEAGRFGPSHLREAIAQTGTPCDPEDLVALLVSPDATSPRRALMTDVLDARRDTVHGMAWCDFVAHSLSQFCAAHFDEGQAKLGPDRTGGLYPSWRRMAEYDRSPALLMGFDAYRSAVRRLPSRPRALIAFALESLEIPEAERESYLTSLLLRLNGWASWCAYRRWQAQLAGGSDDQIVDLLALRLAWEWLLLVGIPDPETAPRWRAAVAAWPALDRSAEASIALDWVLQRALEIAYQEELCRGLERGLPTITAGTDAPAGMGTEEAPAIQAAFCIDVRSEVFRRALEQSSPAVRTLGFAGFFGLPIEYQPVGAPSARPQLPGLLAPRLRATDQGATSALAQRRNARIDFARSWKRLRTTAVSGFSVVEALGLLVAGDLVSNSLGWSRPVPHPESVGLDPAEQALRKPRLTHTTSGTEIDAAARADLAAGVLRAMSLIRGHARLVALFGHGSDTVNNPHAAGLDCGACCGQTGEVNARALAALLNDADTRRRLSASHGIEIPATTHFIAGLHHTTDDEVSLYDLDEVPASHRQDVDDLRAALGAAGRRARSERAARLGLAALPDSARDQAIRARTTSWSETRPEWGLADNAAFIVAPRERSRALDLGGRSFLHEYRWEEDAGFGVLELIMTAPMIVTHWINFQYYASTVDNKRYGSGNKVLHNVVGGHLGVFEGNGGDLRIGLPLQSLHDGDRWVHTPLRISVFIEAPRDAIDAIVEKHALVRRLIENEWIFLFQIDAEGGGIQARRRGGWSTV
jgi:uncharacterized protein YbcC (UPF0753/DUF2309 family)